MYLCIGRVLCASPRARAGACESRTRSLARARRRAAGANESAPRASQSQSLTEAVVAEEQQLMRMACWNFYAARILAAVVLAAAAFPLLVQARSKHKQRMTGSPDSMQPPNILLIVAVRTYRCRTVAALYTLCVQ